MKEKHIQIRTLFLGKTKYHKKYVFLVSKLRGSKLMGMLYLISITKMVCMVNFFGLNDRYICILHDLGDILEV